VQRSPDLVINLGDMSLDGARRSRDLDISSQALANLGCPILSIPGNHDVGDLASVAPDQPIAPARRQAYIDRFGADYWSRDFEGWRLIGLDTMLIGSDLEAERDQYE
jgi:3',5'-cyclic AMP phosphodiesterase CpdA